MPAKAEPKYQNLRIGVADYELFKKLQAELEQDLAYGAKLTATQVFALCVSSASAAHAAGTLDKSDKRKR